MKGRKGGPSRPVPNQQTDRRRSDRSRAPSNQTRTALAFQRVFIAAVLTFSCAGPSSAPRPHHAFGPTHGKSSPVPSSSDRATSESAPEPERFPPEREPTWPDKSYGSNAVLAPVPSTCRALEKHSKAGCSIVGDARAALAAAFASSASTDPLRTPWLERVRPAQFANQAATVDRRLKRDLRLSELEACPQFPAGFIRQLRADLFVECAPTIARLGSTETASLPKNARATLHALTFAARLQRFEADASVPLVKRVTKKTAEVYVERHLEPWLSEHLQWLRQQEVVPDEFAQGSYARAVALWALARAWAKLQGAVALRPNPVDRELSRNYELRTRLYRAIDAATEELRASGSEVFRRALDALTQQGTTRPHWGRTWLTEAVAPAAKSKRWSSPLFHLLLPRLELAAQPSSWQSLLEQLPPYYAAQLVSADDLHDQATLASLLTNGLAPSARQSLMTTGHPAQLWALAQLRVRLGILTHRRRQFEWAHEHLARLKRGTELSAKQSLLGSLVESLRRGPRDASAWPNHALPLFDTAALQFVAEHDASALERGIARANQGELMWAGEAPMPELQKGYQQLHEAKQLLADTPYENCVEQSLDEKRDTWKPLDQGTPCQRHRRAKKLRSKKSRPSGAGADTSLTHLYYPECRLLSWQYQRLQETRGTLDAVCQ